MDYPIRANKPSSHIYLWDRWKGHIFFPSGFKYAVHFDGLGESSQIFLARNRGRAELLCDANAAEA